MDEESELTRLRAQVRDLQAQLVQSEKMATLGALTAGVAHELNNPIGFVKNNTMMLGEYLQTLIPVLREVVVLMKAPDAPEQWLTRLAEVSQGEDLTLILDDIQPLLDDSLDGVARLQDIVSGLRRFARIDNPEGELFSIERCVEDTLKVAWNELKYKAQVIQEFDHTPSLNGKPGEINQVILNLLVNAAQALVEPGEIRIRARQLNHEVELSIADTGCGIAPEALEQVFTPFFTTKPANKGTGLGLAISRDIVTAHGGRIEVSSVLGQGSEFRVFLPLPEDEDEQESEF